MSQILRVPFGLLDEKLYEPRQVQNGKACACMCPACKRPLIARQNAATPHFAHSPGEECAHAFETAVHLAAKQIITERRELRLPVLIYSNQWKRDPQPQTIIAEKIVTLESVESEIWLDDMRPDLVATSNGQKYLVEIAVTHFVDEVKIAKIRQRLLPSFEICTASQKNTFTFSTLEELLFTSAYPATWLYHPLTEEMRSNDTREAQTEQDAIEAQRHARTERFRKYRELSPDDKLTRNLSKINITKQQLKEFTTFVPHEKSFIAPREVWQSAVLAYLVNKEEEQGIGDVLPCYFTPDDCLSWLQMVFTVKPVIIHGEIIAFQKYVHHLAVNLGLIKKVHSGDYELIKKSKLWVTWVNNLYRPNS